MFNTLKYAIQLEEAGLTREQAEVHMRIMSEIVETNLATKQDLKDLRIELHNDFSAFRSEMRNEFNAFKTDIENRFLRLEDRLTIKLGTIVSVALAVAVAFLKLS